MKQILRAERLKTVHTWIMPLACILPVVIGCYSYYFQTYYFISNNLNFWYVTIYPFLTVVLAGMGVQIDGKMKNRAVLGLPIQLKSVWIAKVLVVTGISAVSNLILCLITMAGGEVLRNYMNEWNSSISSGRILLAGILIFISTFWQVPLCMYLSQKIGMIPAVLINTVLNLFCACTVSLGSVWYLFPYGYCARLMIPMLHTLPSGLMVTEHTNQKLLSLAVIFPAILVSIILYLVFLGVGMKHYRNKEAV